VKVLFAFAPKHLISAQIVSCVPVFGWKMHTVSYSQKCSWPSQHEKGPIILATTVWEKHINPTKTRVDVTYFIMGMTALWFLSPQFFHIHFLSKASSKFYSLSIVPYSITSSLGICTRSSAYFRVRSTCPHILKFPEPSWASLLRYSLYNMNRIIS
jgi:hypothetical protein